MREVTEQPVCFVTYGTAFQDKGRRTFSQARLLNMQYVYFSGSCRDRAVDCFSGDGIETLRCSSAASGRIPSSAGKMVD